MLYNYKITKLMLSTDTIFFSIARVCESHTDTDVHIISIFK